ncbi:hypothetical protein NAI79_10780 [Francisella tularensis subsp. holarctica]|nr:hypothetical protein [Francisella tularensis]MDE4998807.1 hypothetical protein [Francisella tularensis subsp. holarctica]
MTPIAKIRSDSIISSILLYFLVALISSGSNFKGFSEEPIYIKIVVLCNLLSILYLL